MSFFGNRLAEAIEDIVDLEHEKYGHLDLDKVLDMLDWTDNIAAGSAVVLDNWEEVKRICKQAEKF